jgi:hypothetical protein
MPDEPQSARVVEYLIVRKYDGDPPTTGEDKAPVETLVFDQRDPRDKGEGPCPSHDSGLVR